jgi:hypothetical protein
MTKLLGVTVSILLFTLSAGPARAEPGEYSVSYAERPLTPPRGQLELDADFGVLHINIPDTGDIDVDDTFVSLAFGGSYGIMDDLQVGAEILPLQLSPEFLYGEPELFALYRFVRGQVDVGGRIALAIPFRDEDNVHLEFYVPVLIHLGTTARLDLGLNLDLEFGEGASFDDDTGEPEDFGYSWSIPVAFAFQATPNLFLGPRTAFGWSEFDIGETIFSPLGIFAGYTIARGDGARPMLDIIASFDFPFFFSWGELYPDTVTTDVWALGLTARFFHDLMGGSSAAAPPPTDPNAPPAY